MSIHDLIDASRLRPEERELWEEMVASYDPDDPKTGPYLLLWEFGYICMLQLWGPPEVVSEKLNETENPRAPVEYLDNVRRARDAGRCRFERL